MQPSLHGQAPQRPIYACLLIMNQLKPTSPIFSPIKVMKLKHSNNLNRVNTHTDTKGEGERTVYISTFFFEKERQQGFIFCISRKIEIVHSGRFGFNFMGNHVDSFFWIQLYWKPYYYINCQYGFP